MSEAAAAVGFSRLLSDERLTRRAVGGDERAFAAIFRRYHQSLYRFCLAIVGSPEDAQDALQNTMIKVLRALPGEERKIELKPWLYRIAHNESIDLLRRRRETRELDVEQPAPGYGLAEDAATRERLRRLLADLRELPERQREVLVMREMAGLDFEEIGVALETSGAVARQTLYEARKSLRQMEEGREMACDEVTRALSDGDGRITRRRDVRAHLRSCARCRSFRDEINGRRQDFAALAPLPAVAAAGLLQGLLGAGSQTAAGGGLAAALGGGAAKTIGASAAAKGVATAAVVAAVGVTAADRSGVIHLGLPGEGGAKSSPATPGGGAGYHHHPGDGHGHGMPGQRGGNAGNGKGSAAGKGNAAPGKAAAGAGAAPGQKAKSKGRHEANGQGNAYGASPAPGPPLDKAGDRGQEKEKQQPGSATDGQEGAAGGKPEVSKPSGGEGGSPPEATPKPPATPSKDPPANPPQGAAPDAPPPPQSPQPPAKTVDDSTPGPPADPGKGSEKKP